jgi:uncharacterized membrane protein YdbT with pleckstrin-like domain
MTDAYLNNLLGEREKILLVTHQHWFQLFRSILLEIVLAIITVVGVILVYITLQPVTYVFLGLALLIIPILSALRDVMIWNNHKYVVTTLRVIQVFGIFNKNVTDSSLEKVNDVKMDQSILGRIFDFGDIEILTASELGINRFTFIGEPVRFKTAMLDAKFRLEQERQPYATSPAAQMMMDVPRLIQELDELRKKGAISEEEFREKKTRLLARL